MLNGSDGNKLTDEEVLCCGDVADADFLVNQVMRFVLVNQAAVWLTRKSKEIKALQCIICQPVNQV